MPYPFTRFEKTVFGLIFSLTALSTSAQSRFQGYFEEIEFEALPVYFPKFDYYSQGSISPVAFYPFRGKEIDSATWVGYFPQDQGYYTKRYGSFWFYLSDKIIAYLVRDESYTIELLPYDTEKGFLQPISLAFRGEGDSGWNHSGSWLTDLDSNGSIDILNYYEGEGWIFPDSLYSYQGIDSYLFEEQESIFVHAEIKEQEQRLQYPSPIGLFEKRHHKIPANWAIILQEFNDLAEAEKLVERLWEGFKHDDKYGLSARRTSILEKDGLYFVSFEGFDSSIRARIAVKELIKRGFTQAYDVDLDLWCQSWQYRGANVKFCD